MTETRKLNLVSHIRPLHLMTLVVLYSLGVGFGRYLGERIDSIPFLIGLLWILSISLGLNFLGDYFQTPFDRGLVKEDQEVEEPKKNISPDRSEILLYISVVCLAVGAVLTVILGLTGYLSLSSALFMGIFFLFYCLLIVPGVSLDLSGIGEFITSIILVVLPPAFAYLLQVGTFHRFLYLGIFPLFPLHLAMILVLRLKTYPTDIKEGRKTLLVRLGWLRGVFLHNLLVLSGFVLFGVALLFGMPTRMVLPVFFTLPATGFLVWYLSRLQEGAAVRWPLIILLSFVNFFLPVYLITFTAWVR